MWLYLNISIMIVVLFIYSTRFLSFLSLHFSMIMHAANLVCHKYAHFKRRQLLKFILMTIMFVGKYFDCLLQLTFQSIFCILLHDLYAKILSSDLSPTLIRFLFVVLPPSHNQLDLIHCNDCNDTKLHFTLHLYQEIYTVQRGLDNRM